MEDILPIVLSLNIRRILSFERILKWRSFDRRFLLLTAVF